ncbi:TlyA family RNA methyltransferase [Floccifex sp.]|uniref:TlyA family RNA methyltransferase n=1 Tax=Floccifex sp. TaxID=2815810 RepID=UPI003F005F13
MRLDKACMEQISSRSKAQDLIKEGYVFVNGKCITKPSFDVNELDKIEIQAKEDDYVSRAAYKLKAAFDEFNFSVENQVVLDIGASTGGFTDLCLQKGAKKVYALDVGHLQLAEKLDQDSRVVKMEGYNARNLTREWFEDDIDFICMDVSFISAKTILSAVFSNLNVSHMAILIKPQFECGPQYLNKQGVLKDKKIQQKVVEDVEQFVFTNYAYIRMIPCPIKGRNGNQEFILYAKERRTHD